MLLLKRLLKVSRNKSWSNALGTQFANCATTSEGQQKSLKEQCFLVSEDDKVIGRASKKECHEIVNDQAPPLHRAFSVFLFNNHGDLLLQKRSSAKITYPNHYTNSCCSHPIADVPGEDDETDALGIKKAAIRRLNFELGIATDAIPLEKVHYLTRILYSDLGDGMWGEHELDYILFIKHDVKIKPNPDEISEITFVPFDDCETSISQLEGPLTPWFRLVLKHRLKMWWTNLDNLEKYTDHKKIIKFCESR